MKTKSDKLIRIQESRGGFDISLTHLGWSRAQVSKTEWAENLADAHDAAIEMRNGLHPDEALECDIYCEMGRS